MKSIRRYLTLVLSVSMAVLLAVSGVLVWTLVRQGLVGQFDTALLARARILTDNIEEDDGEIQIDKNLLHQTDPERALSEALWEVTRADGTSLLHFAPGSGRRLPDIRQPEDNGPMFYATTMGPGVPARAVSLRLDAKDDKQGLYRNLTLVTALPSHELNRTLRTLALVLLGTGGVAVLLLVPLLENALRRGLRPLGDLAKETAGIDAGKLDTRLDDGACPEEIRPIASTLNALLERLESSFVRERRFSSDVAHELRTPVAELRSLADLVAGWPAEATPAAFADAGAIAREMEDIVNRLTLLSRTDAGTQPVGRMDMDLTALVQEALDRAAPGLEARGHSLASHLSPVRVRSDPALWKMILANLIGNAVDHAPPSSRITVELTPQAFILTNPAPALTPEDLPRLFDRFWRKETSRTGYGHSGLGLSLVHSLASLLGPAPEARLTPDQQLQLSLALPRAPAATPAERAPAR
jgi:signal transduction histidine kinase